MELRKIGDLLIEAGEGVIKNVAFGEGTFDKLRNFVAAGKPAFVAIKRVGASQSHTILVDAVIDSANDMKTWVVIRDSGSGHAWAVPAQAFQELWERAGNWWLVYDLV